MSGIIVYRSSTGSTKQYAEWIAEETGFALHESRDKTIAWETADTVVIGCPIIALKPALDRAKSNMGMSLLGGMLEVLWYPEAVLRWFARRFKPLIRALVVRTAALTNIGPLATEAGDFGPARARSYSILGPCHPGPAVLFTASGFGGDLTVHLGYDGACLDRRSAQTFLSRLAQSFRDVGTP